MPWRKKVLSEIKPNKKEELELKSAAKKIIGSIKLKGVKCVMGGSSAKGTWLRGNHDVDIYVKFDPKIYSGLNISEILRHKVKKGNLVHGSRDYIQFNYKGYDVELIPIMDIKKVDDAQNITDISPFHKKWVRKHKEFVNDVRLAKAFAKANGFYGAESYIKGFSGYSLEVLTIHYGGFDNLIKEVSKWKAKTILDPENYHKGKVKLNQSKMISPLVVVDPVQDTRNVTAVVSRETYKLFRDCAKRFLKAKIKEEFFVKDEFSIEGLELRKKGKLICLDIVPLDGKRDVVGAKLLKSYDFIKRKLKENDFELHDSGWHWEDNAILWFMVENAKLSTEVKHYGPLMKSKDRLKKFKAKWKGKKILNEDGVSYVLREREFTDVELLLEALLAESYVSTRVSEFKGSRIFK
jgi:tRNA nucleotidyltransferase (CCA-adding enzyme)